MDTVMPGVNETIGDAIREIGDLSGTNVGAAMNTILGPYYDDVRAAWLKLQ